MRVAISGSSGFIGSAIVSRFKQAGYWIAPIVRPESKNYSSQMTIRWDPSAGTIDAAALENQDVIIHLSGVSIAGQRWTPAYKDLILQSRLKTTELLSKTVAQLRNPPKVFFCASAVGFYGSQGPEHILDESSSRGEGFLADVCEQWEKATKSAEASGVRVVQMRFGTVIGKGGGALEKMLPVFKMGLAGRLGNGKQVMSWIALPEIPEIMLDLIRNNSLRGPVNFVSPEPVTNMEFTKTLSSLLRRPAVFPVPSVGLKALFGEMGDTLLLQGADVYPRRLIKAGYKFQYPELKAALATALL